ncbi:hypothetical protein KIN20_007445 [Parelaphostrongylus tenuis]|uniref:Protein kinase domain-containing protein n=1 Tax=Parelaphostrongylus tenuis TaxID=148309 RepID=A0AAD5QJ70_PARTN|nr:hypothetical protein KIN20_007445 [Parelaphostrongylus tenuis]
MGMKKKRRSKQKYERERMKKGDLVQSEQFTWRVIKLLGAGGFGDVYKVVKERNPDKTECAMKTEMVIGNKLMLRLKVEVLVLMKCHEQTDPKRKGHFVAFVDRGKTNKFKAGKIMGSVIRILAANTEISNSSTLRFATIVHKFLVMALVGPSLEDIRRKDLVRNYSMATAMTCCVQALTALRDLHGIGYLHRALRERHPLRWARTDINPPPQLTPRHGTYALPSRSQAPSS